MKCVTCGAWAVRAKHCDEIYCDCPGHKDPFPNRAAAGAENHCINCGDYMGQAWDDNLDRKCHCTHIPDATKMVAFAIPRKPERLLDIEEIIGFEPCPFCGEDPELVEVPNYSWYVECKNRSCNMVLRTKTVDSKTEAIMNWNTRND